MEHEIRWAVLGTGVNANEMAQALQKMGRTLYGVANRTQEKAIAFAQKYGVCCVYESIDAMFEDPLVDVIYITTPHNTHYPFIKKSLMHGKHVFVEKSITLNSEQLEEMMTLAKQKQCILAEAMTIWHMPIYRELWKRVKQNDWGKVQMITVNFGSYKEYDMSNRFFNRHLAGGSLLDIGVYALAVVRSFMDEKPTEILSQVKIIETQVDEQATILCKNGLNQMATVALSLHSKQPKHIMISCEHAYIEMYEFPRGHKATITDASTGETETIELGCYEKALYYELIDMEHAIKTKDDSHLFLMYTKDVMDIMSELRKQWNVIYPEEEEGLCQSA